MITLQEGQEVHLLDDGLNIVFNLKADRSIEFNDGELREINIGVNTYYLYKFKELMQCRDKDVSGYLFGKLTNNI